MRVGTALLASILVLAQAAPSMGALPQPPVPFGPKPDWDRYKALAEAAVKERLVDPDSARFTWNYGYAQGVWKPFLQGKVWGYVTCAEVNSKNRMGGYTGGSMFAVVIDDDKVRTVDIARNANDVPQAVCQDAINKRMFPPATEMASSAHADASGFQMSVVPLGVYVADVAPDSAAGKAGLAAGMTVTQINGVALKGMDLAVVRQILANSAGTIVLSVLNHDPIRLAQTARTNP